MPRETPAQERYYQRMREAEARRKEEEAKKVSPAELRREEYATRMPPREEPTPKPQPSRIEELKEKRGLVPARGEMRRLVGPTLESIKEAGLPRLSDVIFERAEEAGKQPPFYGLPSPQRVKASLQVLGGIVETGEAYAEIVAPYPVPMPKRPVTPARVTGLVAGGLAVGAVAGWVVEPVTTELISKPAQQWLTKKYVEKGPLEWTGWKEKAVMKLTGVKPSLAPSVVSYPAPGAVGMKGLEAQRLAWELTQAPKTAGLMITKVGPAKTVFAFTRGVGYTPMAVTLAKAMGVKEMGGRQAIIQITKPELKTMPFIPTVEPFKETAFRLPQILGLGIIALPRIVERPKQRERLEPLTMPRIIPIQEPISEQMEKQMLSPIVGVSPMLEVAPMQEMMQIQRQAQKTVQTFAAPPTPTLMKPQAWFFEDPFKRRRYRRKVKEPFGLFGRYPRVYPLATPKQVLEVMVIGKSKRRRKRK